MAVGLPGAGRLRAGLLLGALILTGCPSDDDGGPDWCAGGPSVTAVSFAPTIVPGSRFEISGTGFDASCGGLTVFFRGSFEGRNVEAEALADVISTAEVRYEAGPELLGSLGGDAGRFVGELGVRRRDEGGATREAAVPVAFDVAAHLVPSAGNATPESVTLNAVVVVAGSGFLEGAEGTSEVVLDGTFRVDGGGTRSVTAVRLPAEPLEAHDRTRAAFPFAPAIAGILPGAFTGTLVIENRHGDGTVTASAPLPVTFTLGASFVTDVVPRNPTLGAIATITGAGFIGGAADQTLTIRLDGTATPRGGSPAVVSGLELVPVFVDGGRAEYTIVPVRRGDVLVAEDFDFSWGTFAGTATPVLRYGAELAEGLPTSIDLAIGPTRQVVFVSFLAGFSDALRDFGLRAVEAEVRSRVLDKFRRVYDGINLDVRAERPEDYYPGGYAVVEIGGPDPNGRGLFGYDNTPGKDAGNLRLHDHVGGANAEVQEDGYAGFGGVFVRSFLCWSSHRPDDLVCPDGVADPDFDRVFDPVRSREVVAGESPAGPDAARAAAIEAAVSALGNLVGDTAAHEFGHSLGMANPYGPSDAVHHEPPADGCLMDSGSYRPFAERAELAGTTPGGWCGEERGYLEAILPVGP
ncbi:MAG: hypothetical protein HY907_13830 [Deltaproteobacteria bacterium]|nr:hypothetical protein [Deltaproteobacteria bacterium]